MKKFMAVLMITALLSGTAMASSHAEGGGSGGSQDDSQLSTILMITVVVGFTALLVGDIIADDATDSQDALAGVSVVDSATVSVETGVDWNNLGSGNTGNDLPELAVGIFPVENGRGLARYISGLLAPEDQISYRIHGDPVALGTMSSGEAAATAFSFMQCDYFLTAEDNGFSLYLRDSASPVWTLAANPVDSASVRDAAADLMEYLSTP